MLRTSLKLIFCTAIIGSACSSTGPKVVERLEGYDDTPDWATGAKVMWSEEEDMFFANITTMAENTRPDACMKAAATSARSEMLKYIKSNISESGQLNDEDVAGDPAFESYTSFLAQGSASGARVINRYYDKRVFKTDAGIETIKMRCAAKIAVNKKVLAKQLNDALTKKTKGNSKVREKLQDTQNKFLDSL